MTRTRDSQEEDNFQQISVISRRYRLTKDRDFREVYKKNKKIYSKSFLLLVHFPKQSAPNPIIGVVASKKVGNAVQRNKAKRRIRAILSQSLANLPSYKFVFILNSQLLEVDYKGLEAEVKLALGKI